jgi:hypothetical protein
MVSNTIGNILITEKFKLSYGVDGVYYDFNPGTVQPTNSESNLNYSNLIKKYAFGIFCLH